MSNETELVWVTRYNITTGRPYKIRVGRVSGGPPPGVDKLPVMGDDGEPADLLTPPVKMGGVTEQQLSRSDESGKGPRRMEHALPRGDRLS